MSAQNHCRFCGCILNITFINLGFTPLSNAFLSKENIRNEEKNYPLHAKICKKCFLVQIPQFESPENIFNDYAYFSSYSESWLKHCADYTNMMMKRFSIDSKWHVVEIASNDGYLLQYFKAKAISVLGIEPAENVATVAKNKGIPTVNSFFGECLAKQMQSEGNQANLIIANNVLAHVPNLNDFVSGLKILLAPTGIITIEVPHLLSLIEHKQFDTIYHEHFSYFSFLTAQQIFTKHRLTICDVEKIPSHGGSMRIFVKHAEDQEKKINERVNNLLTEEKEFGLDDLQTYKHFPIQAEHIKKELLAFVLEQTRQGKKIAGYGAPAKGNTLLNFCGIDKHTLSFTVDKNPYKQGKYLPGTKIPIYHPDKIKEKKPDYLLLLPWNLKQEIMEQMNYIKNWQGKFVVPIPQLEVY